jgi:Glycosyl hydrolase family 3 C-terminal domain
VIEPPELAPSGRADLPLSGSADMSPSGLRHSATAVLMPWLENVPAVLAAWSPRKSGDALAGILFGAVNPSGGCP